MENLMMAVATSVILFTVLLIHFPEAVIFSGGVFRASFIFTIGLSIGVLHRGLFQWFKLSNNKLLAAFISIEVVLFLVSFCWLSFHVSAAVHFLGPLRLLGATVVGIALMVLRSKLKEYYSVNSPGFHGFDDDDGDNLEHIVPTTSLSSPEEREMMGRKGESEITGNGVEDMGFMECRQSLPTTSSNSPEDGRDAYELFIGEMRYWWELEREREEREKKKNALGRIHYKWV